MTAPERDAVARRRDRPAVDDGRLEPPSFHRGHRGFVEHRNRTHGTCVDNASGFVEEQFDDHDAAQLDGLRLLGKHRPDVDLFLGRRNVRADAVKTVLVRLSRGKRPFLLAVAARIEGSVVHEATRPGGDPQAELRIAMPSGILTVAASVAQRDGAWHAEQGAFYRTARRLFEGAVFVRASRVAANHAPEQRTIATVSQVA